MYEQEYPWSYSSAKEATNLIDWCSIFDVHAFLTLFWRQRMRHWIRFLLAYTCLVGLVQGRDRNGLNFPSWLLFCLRLSHLSALISVSGDRLYWDATICFDTRCVLWLALFFFFTNLYWSLIQLYPYWCFRQIWVVLLCVLIAPFTNPLIECNNWVTYISPSKFHLLEGRNYALKSLLHVVMNKCISKFIILNFNL